MLRRVIGIIATGTLAAGLAAAEPQAGPAGNTTATQKPATAELQAKPGTTASPAMKAKPAATGPQVAVLETALGNIVIKFDTEDAPKTVANFKKLARDKFYDGTYFHRVIARFMIQGGDPNTKDPNKKSEYGMGGPPTKLKAEFNEKSHKRGIVSMARSNHPDSAGSQFFIVVKDSPFLDKQYTAFGEVVKGMEVADKIVSAPKGQNDLPNERIELTVTIVEK